MNKNQYKKPNILVYSIFRFASKIISKFKFNLHIIGNDTRGKKGPYVIIANHESSIDFIFLAATVKRKINFVISNSFYQSLKIQPLLDACGVIPKQQFQTQTSDLKKMKRVVENNGVLTIYPAGLMSENGVSTAIPKATGKLLKWLGKDVYVAYISGTYLSSPKWSTIKRKGRVNLNISKLLSAEEIETIDIEKLNELVEEKLKYNAYLKQGLEPIIYKNGDNLEGLETVLYKCPKCGSEFSIKTIEHNILQCDICGNSAKSNKYGLLEKLNEEDIIYKYPNEWYDFIQSDLQKQMLNNNDYYLEAHALVDMIDYKKHKFVNVGDAIIKLDKDKFTITGVLKNENIQKEVSIATFPMIPFKPGLFFEIQDGNDIYRIKLDNGKEVMKWIMTLKIFFNLYHNN